MNRFHNKQYIVYRVSNSSSVPPFASSKLSQIYIIKALTNLDPL